MNEDTAQSAKRQRVGGGRAFHSRLEPFVDFIHEQRQARKTWKEIAAMLAAEKSCTITAQGIHQFYRRYVKQKAQPHWEREAVGTPHLATGEPEQTGQSNSTNPAPQHRFNTPI
jgi:hypothetical protein